MSVVSDALSNPVNLVLAVVLGVLALQYIVPADPNSNTLRPSVAHARLRMDPSIAYSSLPASHPNSTIWNRYTPRTLALYDGTGKEGSDRILLAINGKVFDVSSGRSFYGPDGPYGNFAGRDASRGMAKQSFDAEMLTPLDQPIDDLADITPSERCVDADKEKHAGLGGSLLGEIRNCWRASERRCCIGGAATIVMVRLTLRRVHVPARTCRGCCYSTTSASQKLFADALKEESQDPQPSTPSRIARHLDPVWTGDGAL